MRRGGVILFLAAAVQSAGCGGGDASTGPFPPGVAQPETKVEFLREADRICHASEAQIEAAGDDLFTGPGRPDPDEVARVALKVAVPALQAELSAIESLPVPAGDEREVDAILAATKRGIAEIRADPRGLVDGPPRGLVQAQRLAQRYGSSQCGIPAPPGG